MKHLRKAARRGRRAGGAGEQSARCGLERSAAGADRARRWHSICALPAAAPQDKRESLGQALAGQGIEAAVLAGPDSIAWLLNIRGADVPRTPFALGFAILHKDGAVELFMDRRKFTPGLEAHLGNRVAVNPPEAFAKALDRLGQAQGAGADRSGKRRPPGSSIG